MGPSATRLLRAMGALDRSPRGRDEKPPKLPPPIVLGDEISALRDLVAVSFERSVADRRFGWALLRVAELVLASMEEQRLMDDDRPGLALAAWRDWCLGEAPQRLYDAYNVLRDASSSARDRGHPLFIACMGLEQLALAARGIQMRATSEDFVILALDAAIFGLDLRETYDVSTSRVEDEFRFGLTERGP